MKDNQVDEIELKGMASSFIHLYEDSLYQGTNEISGDEIVLQLKNDNATELVSNGGVIGKFIPSSSNSSGQEKVCLLYTSPSPRDLLGSRMPSSA